MRIFDLNKFHCECLKRRIKNDLEDCIKTFETTGALPSTIMEKPYELIRVLQKDSENQKYITFMVMNYYLPKYGGRN